MGWALLICLKAIPACHWSQHKHHSPGLPWAYHKTTKLCALRALGEMQQSANNSAYASQKYCVSSCWGLFWSHYTPPECETGSVWMSKCCGGRGLVCQTSATEIKAVLSELRDHHWPAAAKLFSVHAERWVSLSNSAVPQVPPVLNAYGTFLVSAGNEWKKTDNTYFMCKAETTSAYIFLSWNK